MEADAHVNLVGFHLLSIVGAELGLNILRALDGVHDRRELDQETIARRLDDMALVGSDGVLDGLVMNGQYLQRTGFVSAHLAAKAHHVGEHNGGQTAGLGPLFLGQVPMHGGDYPLGASRLSTGGES